MSSNAGVVNSQDVFAAPGVPISVVAAGGGGALPANPQVSTLSALGLSNISSINGAPYVGAGGVPANLVLSSLSTLALNSISSINGVPYTGSGGVPANLGVSSLVVNGDTVTVLGNAGAPTQGRAILAGSDSGFSLTGFNNANTETSFINTDNTGGSNRIIMSVAEGGNTCQVILNANTGVNISSLTVSSINGGEVGTGTRAVGSFNLIIPSFSTPTNAGVYPINAPLVEFSTVVGRSYVLDFTAGVVPIQPSVDPATIPLNNELSFGVVSGSTAIASDTFQTQMVYNVSRGIRSTFTTTNSVSFIAGDTGSRLNFGYLSDDSVNFNFTNSTIVSSLTRVLVTDLGVI
jgi:hypothetical protein